jgi:hypothetical protein
MLKALVKFLVLGTLVSAITGCSTNNLSIRFAYSRMDNNIARNFGEYADFDQAQQQWIRQSAREFQLWHRKNELPLYADLFLDLAQTVESGDKIDTESVQEIFAKLEELSNRSYKNSPFANSLPFLAGVSDEQVQQIAEAFDRQDQKQLERIREQESRPDNSDRIDKFDNNLDRIGLNLTSEQRMIVDEGMNRYVGSREDRVMVWQHWQLRFLDILRARDQTLFEDIMQKQIDEYRMQMELAYPERSAQNTRIAAQTVAALVNSMTADQRVELVARLRQASAVLYAMSTSKQIEII